MLVVAPTRRELGGVARRGSRLAASGRARAGRGRLTAAGVRAAVVGTGRAAGPRTAALLDAEPGALLVSLGFAGGLDPDLRLGDLVVAGSYRRGSGETAGDHDTAARAAALLAGRGVAAVTGGVLTADEPLLTPDSKHRARAGGDHLVVDMEGYWIAGAAQARGVPHIGLHCVIDEAGFALPAFVAEAVADPRRQWIHALRALRRRGGARDVAVLASRARTASRVLRHAGRVVLGAVPGASAMGGSPDAAAAPPSGGR